ncbi:MAG TPA: prephenate dehydrogenase/arogenate dehydrogenase family protein [Methanocella sp.]|uniref:prephenate dehydrogenase/arogenate dehydrogenase family protein n=1 Tax=Methanocella sp. TaxID=2052833 RepID=UPI002CBDF777|nr:prephenate dehydrogenase/arogenate dehydrogenase family protein [Methanocella sp.]HTY91712.1 prephenate dehydrogenase/arogenate dehydrogenase family protein [Methanocella sp.]
MPFKVLIVGGAGGMGRWCATLFKNAGLEVSISSRGDATDMARSLGVGLSRPEHSGAFDIVVLSVPIDAIDPAASEAAPNMKPGSLLMDLSSLKVKPIDAMLRHAPPGVEVIGAHPLFGPGSESRGMSVVLVPTERSERWLSIIKDIFTDAGYGMLETTAERHDKAMAVVQGLTHFMYVSMGRTLEKANVDLKETSAFRTPVYGITKELLGRVLSQSPGLYALIQSSEPAGEIRRAYVDACRELASELDAGDIEKFIRDFESAARYYGDTAGARKRSERIIRCDMEMRRRVLDAVGQERAFEYGGRAVNGIVKRAGPDDFTLETPDGPMTLKYEDVSAASGTPGAGPFVGRDILVKMPIGADPSVLKGVLSYIEGVQCTGFETSDAPGPDFVVCRFTISVPAGRSEEVLQKILKTIWGLGLEVK